MVMWGATRMHRAITDGALMGDKSAASDVPPSHTVWQKLGGRPRCGVRA
jgi:hypothetical protein